MLDKVANSVLTGREVLKESQACGFGESMEERGMAVCHLELRLGRDRINRHVTMISSFGIL